MRIDVAQARLIIDKHFPDESLTVVSIAVLRNRGYSDDPNLTTYVLDLETSSCFLSLSHPASNADQDQYHPNALPEIVHLLSQIRTQTGIPIAKSTLDTSLAHVPFHYLLSALCPFAPDNMLSLAHARRAGILAPTDSLAIDLRLGAFLGQLHSRVQNDAFGLPVPEGQPPDPFAFVSWEEVFTGLLDGLMTQVEAHEGAYACALPWADVRLYLSRAIGASLFGDVEEASLVWFTGSEEDVYLGFEEGEGGGKVWTGRVAAILPNVAHALWGDPLLECFMMGEGPGEAFMEGYLGSGGRRLVVFARQKTKRVWYTVFLALVVLTKYGVPGPGDEEYVKEKRAWAKETLKQSVEKLKDAPCS